MQFKLQKHLYRRTLYSLAETTVLTAHALI